MGCGVVWAAGAGSAGGETLQATDQGSWGHGFASAAELISHLGWALQQTFPRWPFRAVVISGPQRATGT